MEALLLQLCARLDWQLQFGKGVSQLKLDEIVPGQAVGADKLHERTSCDNLGNMLNDRGKHVEAEPFERRASTIIEQAVGADKGDDMWENGLEGDEEDSSDEPNDEGANNSAEAVAVRRAFLASVHSSAGSQDDEGTWTGDQILSWVTDAMDLAVAVDDRQKGPKTFWLEWSRIDCFLPKDQRQ